MSSRIAGPLVLLVFAAALPSTGRAQGRPDPAAMQAAQREAMQKLAFMDGTWRGEARTIPPGAPGEKHTLTQTERVGAFLGGTIRVIEGRGYEADGSVGFNALGVISYDSAKKTYSMRSWALGYFGDYPLTPTENGFEWVMRFGSMSQRYTATFEDGVWHEVGHRTIGDGDPVQFFEMTLRRIGDTDWPAAGAVPAK